MTFFSLQILELLVDNLGGGLVVYEQLEMGLAQLVPPVVLDVGGPGPALDMQQLARLRVLELDGGQRRQVVVLWNKGTVSRDE